MEVKTVYVAFLDAGGDCAYSGVCGVFKNKEDAVKLCKKRAEEYANKLFPKDYKYEIIGDNSFCVDTFTWKVIEM